MRSVFFGSLEVGQRFRLKHLAHKTFMKIAPKEGTGDRPNFPSMPFLGKYNSIAENGSRWVWDEDRLVELVEG